jgi:hypothetical protein
MLCIFSEPLARCAGKPEGLEGGKRRAKNKDRKSEIHPIFGVSDNNLPDLKIRDSQTLGWFLLHGVD